MNSPLKAWQNSQENTCASYSFLIKFLRGKKKKGGEDFLFKLFRMGNWNFYDLKTEIFKINYCESKVK